MKKHTLDVDESKLANERREPAASDSAPLAERDTKSRLAAVRIRELSERSTAEIGSSRWARGDLHER